MKKLFVSLMLLASICSFGQDLSYQPYNQGQTIDTLDGAQRSRFYGKPLKSTISKSTNKSHFFMDFGYSIGSNGFSNEYGYIIKNGIIFAAGFTLVGTPLVGEDYSPVISFRKYPEDVYETGIYHSGSFNVGSGLYFLQKFYATCYVEFNTYNYYENRYCAHEILGQYGYYYMETRDHTEPNLKFGIGYASRNNFLKIGLTYSTVNKLGISIGLFI